MYQITHVPVTGMQRRKIPKTNHPAMRWVGLEVVGPMKDPLCVRRWQSEGGSAQTYTKHTKDPLY